MLVAYKNRYEIFLLPHRILCDLEPAKATCLSLGFTRKKVMKVFNYQESVAA